MRPKNKIKPKNKERFGDKKYKVAYIHSTSFPSTEANTFDAIWTADALSKVMDTTFFMPRVNTSKSKLRQHYEIGESPLKLKSLHLDLIPDRVLIHYKHAYEKLLTLILRYSQQWVSFGGRKVLFVREPKQLLYWGLNRKKMKWTQDWLFCYEAHDTLGLDPIIFYQAATSKKPQTKDEKQNLMLLAAQNFDLIICNTQILAEDMKIWSEGTLDPQVLHLASPLPRLSKPPEIDFGERIVFGYIGTIDKLRGVDILLESLHFLPESFTLRIVGRFRKEEGVDPNWLNKYLEDPDINHKLDLNLVNQIDDVAGEIDRCDIVIQTASKNIHDARYAAPLKSYGYMVRGKPIVAGDVMCHRELFTDGVDAMLYELSPESLANSIISLVNNPDLALKLATNSWEKSKIYNLDRKIEDMIEIFDSKQQIVNC